MFTAVGSVREAFPPSSSVSRCTAVEQQSLHVPTLVVYGAPICIQERVCDFVNILLQYKNDPAFSGLTLLAGPSCLIFQQQTHRKRPTRPHLVVGRDLMVCRSWPWQVKMCTTRFDPEVASRAPWGCQENITGPFPWCLASITNNGSISSPHLECEFAAAVRNNQRGGPQRGGTSFWGTTTNLVAPVTVPGLLFFFFWTTRCYTLIPDSLELKGAHNPVVERSKRSFCENAGGKGQHGKRDTRYTVTFGSSPSIFDEFPGESARNGALTIGAWWGSLLRGGPEKLKAGVFADGTNAESTIW